MDSEFAWAVCPRIDHFGSLAPKLFHTHSEALRFLNRQVTFTGSIEAEAIVSGDSIEEARKRRAEILKQRREERKEALRKIASGEMHPFSMPLHLQVRRRKDLGWAEPVPTQHPSSGTRCARLFRNFLPIEEIGNVPVRDLEDVIARALENRLAIFRCFLAEDWRFSEIERDAQWRVGHVYEGRKHANVAEIAAGAVYHLEVSLYSTHPDMTCLGAIDFFTSWQVWHHIAEFCAKLGKSETGRELEGAGKARDAAERARDFVYEQLTAYTHELAPAISEVRPEGAPPNTLGRRELWQKYRAGFPEKIKILDVCWAASQHYSEFKRWLRNVLKDGSTPDRAFRAILTSRKAPREYRPKPRPSGWK
jgi:hypothetical protein